MTSPLYGAVYRPGRAAPARIDRDMALMARLGFTQVTLRPGGEGGFHLPALRRTLTAAGRAGLTAVLDLPDPVPEELRALLEGDPAGAVLLPPGSAEGAAGGLDGADIAFFAAGARGSGGGPGGFGTPSEGGYAAVGVPSHGPRGTLPEPGRTRLAVFTHIASGAACVSLDRWRSETEGDCLPGLVGYDSRLTEPGRECAAVAGELASLSGTLAGLRKEVRLAVLTNGASRALFDRLEGPGRYDRALRAFCDSLFRLNAEYDLIGPEGLVPGRWDLVAAPALCALSDESLAALSAFVAGGGRLIAGGRFAFAGEDLRPRAGGRALRELLGLRRTGLLDAGGTRGVPLRSRHVRLPEGAGLEGLVELLVPGTAAVLAAALHPERGEIPAVAVNAHGRGQTAYLAGEPDPEALDELLDHLLRAFRVPLPGIRFPLVLRRARTRRGGDLIFFLNHSPSPRPLPFGVTLPPWGVQLRENGKIL